MTPAPEPIYQYIKGQGWVAMPGQQRPRVYEDISAMGASFDMICLKCRQRLGLHGVRSGGRLFCPDHYSDDGWSFE